MADFDPPFAHANGSKRMPTSGEIDNGFGCGPADLDLFNGLLNGLYAELGALIVNAGFAPSNADMAQVVQAVRSQALNYRVPGGSSNAITITMAPALQAYTAGLVVRFIAASANTAGVTLNVNGLGAKALLRRDGAALQAGDLAASTLYTAIYDGTAFRSIAPVASDFARVENTAVFTASGTYVATSTSVEVEVIGGGGGGGGSADASGGGVAGNAGGGGGGGGYGYKRITGLTIGTSYAVTVGTGGAGGTNGAGGAGGTSSFSSFVSANGGAGGNWGENTLSVTGTGGTVTGADLACTGGDGGSTGKNVALGANATQSDTQTLYNRGGIAAGGLSTLIFGSTGGAGRGYGSGGGGASGGSAAQGGAGAPGIVIVRK